MSRAYWYAFVRPAAMAVALVALLFLAISCVPSGTRPIPVRPSALAPEVAACENGVQASGAKYRICMPADMATWNTEVLVYAHGYVPYNAPIAIPEDQLYLPDGTYLPDQVTGFGYAFATTSYSANGLAIKQGLPDLVDLVAKFKSEHPAVTHVYLVGASEGGLITTLGAERHPEVFSGGLATCGPIGDFREQLNYLGDFRVVFDYFFPGLIPGSAISIPQALIDGWDTHLKTVVLPVITDPASAISVTQLLGVTHAAFEPAIPETRIATISGTLWYSIFATNDAVTKLGGQPFDNQARVYTGSLNDAALNAAVQRFSADAAALGELAASYQTAGDPRVPLVTLHTTGDEIVPYWHETLYSAKVAAHGRTPWHVNVPVVRYGHCNFTSFEVLLALYQLRDMVANPPRYVVSLPLVMK